MVDGKQKLHVVTPEWLWTCAERWERVDERLYPLQRGGQVKYTNNINIFFYTTRLANSTDHLMVNGCHSRLCLQHQKQHIKVSVCIKVVTPYYTYYI